MQIKNKLNKFFFISSMIIDKKYNNYLKLKCNNFNDNKWYEKQIDYWDK
jgi:hypothetical protein